MDGLHRTAHGSWSTCHKLSASSFASRGHCRQPALDAIPVESQDLVEKATLSSRRDDGQKLSVRLDMGKSVVDVNSPPGKWFPTFDP